MLLKLLFALFATLLPVIASAQVHGPWNTSRQNGIWWLTDSEGRRFYSRGVNIVYPGKPTPEALLKHAYYWGNFFNSLESWRAGVGAQLRGWGFNTRGGWSDPGPELGLALTVDLEVGRQAKFHWFDPFNPDMEKELAARAEQLTAPHLKDPMLLGYYTDNEVGWWNTPLFSWYLGLGWENHTKRELWNVLYRHYNGNWTDFLVDWSPQAPALSFEDLKPAGTKLKLRPGGNGIRAVDRFLSVYTKRYYELTARAIRKAHPGALILGDRMPLYYHQDAVLSIGDNVDVISTNYNVDGADGWIAPYYFDGLDRLSGKPVVVTEYFFAAQENRSGNLNRTERNEHSKAGHLMTVDTQAERVWGAMNATLNFAKFPNVVGAHWFQYCDEPLGGREDGENYNFGLIDTYGNPYEDLTRVFSSINPILETVHAAGRSGRPGSRGDLPNASTGAAADQGRIIAASGPFDLRDQSLLDWDKERTRLVGISTPEPYVPFGDIHLAWSPEGLHMALIANTFVDPRFLDFPGEFPEGEAFQVHLSVENGGRVHQVSVYLTPRKNAEYPDGFEVVPLLYRRAPGDKQVSVPAQGKVQRLNKSLPHMAVELLVPADWLGYDSLKARTPLRLNITAATYHREFIMSWGGPPDLRSIGDPKAMGTLLLEPRN